MQDDPLLVVIIHIDRNKPPRNKDFPTVKLMFTWFSFCIQIIQSQHTNLHLFVHGLAQKCALTSAATILLVREHQLCVDMLSKRIFHLTQHFYQLATCFGFTDQASVRPTHT